MSEIRVLFIDDEQGLVTAVVRRLNLRGISAHGVTSGVDALQLIDEEEFDVAVLDVRMPDIGGLDVMRLVLQKCPRMEVVLLSGHGSIDSVEEGIRLGAFEYLQKPVEIDDLVEVIRRAAEHGDAKNHD